MLPRGTVPGVKRVDVPPGRREGGDLAEGEETLGMGWIILVVVDEGMGTL